MEFKIKENNNDESRLYKIYSGDVIRINQEVYDKYKDYLCNNFILVNLEYLFRHHWYNFWKKDVVAWYDMMKI